MSASILRVGHNVWCRAEADRFGVLVDAAAYYEAFAGALCKAQHSLFVLGWDVDSRTPMDANGGDLSALLRSALAHRPTLQAHFLSWDYHFIYAFEREPLPTFVFGRLAPGRLHFRLDGDHPRGASQHQKIVVVDDAVAFIGGLDLGIRRWDTPEHAPNDPRRTDPKGMPYDPFHDVQVIVSGPIVAWLARLCRERWFRQTRTWLPPPAIMNDPWPPHVRPELTNVEVALARTEPTYAGRTQVREVEHLFADSIRAALHYIYIENQYLTSAGIAGFLAESLAKPSGPEVIIVGPGKCCGWLEENTMGVLRSRLLRALAAADTYDRLRVYYPYVGGEERVLVNVHAKIFIADDKLLRIGSANLSNRSIALDSECDLAIESADETTTTFIRTLRNRLLAEHLGQSVEVIAATCARHSSLIAAIEAFRGGERGLLVLEPSGGGGKEDLVPDARILDPTEPLDADLVLDNLLPEEFKRERRLPFLRVAVTLVLLAGFAAAWHWTPLGKSIDVERLLALAHATRASPFAPLGTIAAFLLGNLVMIPVTLLVVQSGIIFGPLLGAIYALLGALVSASALYWLGRTVGRDAFARLARFERLAALTRPVGRHAVLAVVALRMVPIAPFTLINLAAGATRVRFRHFFLGTLIGMTPGIIALTTFGAELSAVVRRPTLPGVAALLAMLVAVVAFGRWFHRRFVPARPASE